MWLPGLIGRNRELDKIVAITGNQSPFLGCGVGQLLPIIEIPPAYLMNTHDVEIVSASDFRGERIDVLVQKK